MSKSQEVKAELMTGYRFFPLQNNPNLAVLRLDTENEKHWFLASKEILHELSAELEKNALQLESTN